jgi:hypothetical protein
MWPFKKSTDALRDECHELHRRVSDLSWRLVEANCACEKAESRVAELSNLDAAKLKVELERARRDTSNVRERLSNLENSISELKFGGLNQLVGCDLIVADIGHCRIIAPPTNAEKKWGWCDGDSQSVGFRVHVAVYSSGGSVHSHERDIVLTPDEILGGIRSWQQGVAVNAVAR